MFRVLTISLVILLLFPMVTFANTDNIKAAFIRDWNLWTLIGDKETQITKENKKVFSPKWSSDGEWILYQVASTTEFGEENEVWAYNLETKEFKRIARNGNSPAWAPNKNVIAYNDSGILDISDLDQFYNIATGVSDFTWLPDGNGFLLSSSGVLRPDGWTSAILYTKEVTDNYEDVPLFGGADHFFTLPKEIEQDNERIIAVNAGDFAYSPSSVWISFIVSPTASWAMDSNMLCVIDRNGENFEVIDEITTFSVGSPKWAPSTDTIAYIAGGGRLTFGFKNKKLKIHEMPTSIQYTPDNYVDIDFDWVSNEFIITSRTTEGEWSEQPLPILYSIHIKHNKQVAITNPPNGYGDYNPQYIESLEKIIWLRGKSITDEEPTLWKANSDGTEAEAWITNVDSIEFYGK